MKSQRNAGGPSPGDRLWWVALVAAAAVIYAPVGRWLLNAWQNDHFYTHGPLVALLCGWLVYDRWGALKQAPLRPSRWGAPLAGLGIAMAMAGIATDVMSLLALSLLPAVAGVVLATRGAPTLRILAFPLFYFGFAMPLASTTSDANGRVFQPMMEFAAAKTAEITALLGLHPIRSGTLIRYPGYTMNVILPCSGMASVVALGALAALLGYLTGGGGWRSAARIVLLMAVAVPVALGANVARITLTALLGVTCGEQMATGFMHELSGVFAFLVGGIMLFLVNTLLGAILQQSTGRGLSDVPDRGRERVRARGRARSAFGTSQLRNAPQAHHARPLTRQRPRPRSAPAPGSRGSAPQPEVKAP